MKDAVEVVNLDTENYSEKFDDELISIPAGGKIVMNRRRAVKFLGTHAGMDIKTGKMKIKRLDMIPLASGIVKAEPKFVCHVDGLEFTSQVELNEHIRLVHPGQQFTDKRLEEKAKDEKPVSGVACPLCSYIAKNRAGLRVHLANCKVDVPATE